MVLVAIAILLLIPSKTYSYIAVTEIVPIIEVKPHTEAILPQLQPVTDWTQEFNQLPIQEYAKEKVTEKWSEYEWESFNKIINQESRYWEVTTDHNLNLSTAYGLGGFLDSTWSTVGCIKTDEVKMQIDCTIKYIEARYKTPTQAYSFHLRNNYY